MVELWCPGLNSSAGLVANNWWYWIQFEQTIQVEGILDISGMSEKRNVIGMSKFWLIQKPWNICSTWIFCLFIYRVDCYVTCRSVNRWVCDEKKHLTSMKKAFNEGDAFVSTALFCCEQRFYNACTVVNQVQFWSFLYPFESFKNSKLS